MARSLKKLKEQLIKHEGLRLKPYYCSSGKLTIGVGRNLHDNGISNEEVMIMLDNDIKAAAKDALSVLKYFGIDDISNNRLDVIINMTFNMGKNKMLGFKKMFAAIKNGDYQTAAEELLDSKYHHDVGPRAEQLAKQLFYDEY